MEQGRSPHLRRSGAGRLVGALALGAWSFFPVEVRAADAGVTPPRLVAVGGSDGGSAANRLPPPTRPGDGGLAAPGARVLTVDGGGAFASAVPAPTADAGLVRTTSASPPRADSGVAAALLGALGLDPKVTRAPQRDAGLEDHAAAVDPKPASDAGPAAALPGTPYGPDFEAAIARQVARILSGMTPDAGPPDAGAPPPGGAELESFDGPAAAPATAPPQAISDFAAPAAGPTVRFSGHVRGEGGVDLRFESPKGAPLAEDVIDGRLRGLLGVDVTVSRNVRAVLEGRFLVRGSAQRDLDRARGVFEPTLGEAFVDLYTPKADLRVGHQRVALGANAALAPADALNPRDLRESLLLAEPEDAALPVFAVRATGEVGTLSWLAVYAPFFTPSRFALFGVDESLVQPGLGEGFDERRIEPSVASIAQERLLETERPAPFVGDLAVRLRSRGAVKVGASWVWMNEKLPRVVVDPELSAAMASQAKGKTLDPALGTSLLNRFQANETLFTGRYGRSHLLSLEASTLAGPGQLDVDVTYSPRQTFFDASLEPLDKASFSYVVGYSQAEQSDWTWAFQVFGLAIPDLGAKEQVILVEPATVVGASRTAWLHLLVGQVGYEALDGRLAVSVRGAFEPIQQSWAVAPKVTWKGVEHVELWLAAELYEGPTWSPLGYFGRNDKVLVGARLELF